MKKKRKNLKVNITNIYVGMTLFFIIGFIFFGTSKLFMAENIPLNQTELNTEYDLRSNGKFEISSWVYDEDKAKMEVVLITNGIKDYKTELNFSAVTRNKIGVELPLNIVYNDNEIYIIEINNVQKEFQQLAIRLHRSEKDIDNIFDEDTVNEREDDGIFSTIYTDERAVEKESIDEKEQEQYVREITNNMIEDTISKQEEIEQSIVKKNEVIETLTNEVSELQEELLYQTTDEQVETTNEIYKLEKEIENYNKEIKDSETDINNMQTKLERLEQKKRDLKI